VKTPALLICPDTEKTLIQLKHAMPDKDKPDAAQRIRPPSLPLRHALNLTHIRNLANRFDVFS
jgi:hypothetical protein